MEIKVNDPATQLVAARMNTRALMYRRVNDYLFFWNERYRSFHGGMDKATFTSLANWTTAKHLETWRSADLFDCDGCPGSVEKEFLKLELHQIAYELSDHRYDSELIALVALANEMKMAKLLYRNADIPAVLICERLAAADVTKRDPYMQSTVAGWLEIRKKLKEQSR